MDARVERRRKSQRCPRVSGPLADLVRARGGWIVSTHFTLVPGKDGEPLISPHLRTLRPFLSRGDFQPGLWGHALVDELAPADLAVEKIAYSAFYMTRLEWLLRKMGIDKLYVAGLVTNGGITSTVRDAHVRDLSTLRALVTAARTSRRRYMRWRSPRCGRSTSHDRRRGHGRAARHIAGSRIDQVAGPSLNVRCVRWCHGRRIRPLCAMLAQAELCRPGPAGLRPFAFQLVTFAAATHDVS